MKSVLLLEDDENLNRGISLKLSKEGYRVFSAFTILEAKSIFSKENWRIISAVFNTNRLMIKQAEDIKNLTLTIIRKIEED